MISVCYCFFSENLVTHRIKIIFGTFFTFFFVKKVPLCTASFVILFNSRFLRIMKLVLLSFKYQVRHISIELRKTVFL